MVNAEPSVTNSALAHCTKVCSELTQARDRRLEVLEYERRTMFSACRKVRKQPGSKAEYGPWMDVGKLDPRFGDQSTFIYAANRSVASANSSSMS